MMCLLGESIEKNTKVSHSDVGHFNFVMLDLVSYCLGKLQVPFDFEWLPSSLPSP